MTKEQLELLAAVIGPVSAMAGYLGKSVVDWVAAKREKRAGIIAQLQELESLLKASRALFTLQNDKVIDLTILLKKNHSDLLRKGKGYEDTMALCYTVMNEEEKTSHGLIRAYTEHSLQSVNQAVSSWLKSDTNFKTGIVTNSQQKNLAEKLFALEIHMLLWHAKYAFWIPGHPEHALVYMADENNHGLGFPGGLDEVVADVLNELRLDSSMYTVLWK